MELYPIASLKSPRAHLYCSSYYSAVARRVETRILLAGYASTVYVSPRDSEVARALVPVRLRNGIVAIPNGVDTDVHTPCRPQPPSRKGGITLVFSGVMEYLPNIEAVEFLGTKSCPS